MQETNFHELANVGAKVKGRSNFYIDDINGQTTK